MFYVMVQTVCMIIIAIAAVKYLMPDIRRICRVIADSGEVKEKKKKVEKERKDVPTVTKKIAEKVEEKERKGSKKIEATKNDDAKADTSTGTDDSECHSEPEWEK